MSEIYPSNPPLADLRYGGPLADWHFGEVLFHQKTTSDNGHEYVGIVKRVRGGGVLWRIARDEQEMLCFAAESLVSAEFAVRRGICDLQTGEMPQ